MRKKQQLCDNFNKCVQVSEFLSAVSNPVRIGIICYLTTGERSVNEIVDKLKISQPTVSLNLFRLYRAGWLSRRRVGKNVYYKIAKDEYKEIIEKISDLYLKKIKIGKTP